MTYLSMLLFPVCSQEISFPRPGQQWLHGCEEEESRGDGEGAERSRGSHRAQPAS